MHSRPVMPDPNRGSADEKDEAMIRKNTLQKSTSVIIEPDDYVGQGPCSSLSSPLTGVKEMAHEEDKCVKDNLKKRSACWAIPTDDEEDEYNDNRLSIAARKKPRKPCANNEVKLNHIDYSLGRPSHPLGRGVYYNGVETDFYHPLCLISNSKTRNHSDFSALETVQLQHSAYRKEQQRSLMLRMKHQRQLVDGKACARSNTMCMQPQLQQQSNLPNCAASTFCSKMMHFVHSSPKRPSPSEIPEKAAYETALILSTQLPHFHPSTHHMAHFT
mmetsp:Transcript_37870/g.55789  ORF Transcript_37870/g.55789 Transcript_37870/m.55789 type:complete len:273 (-) Transcript_37870:107-925(-)|eukprot:CAMPEP_0195527564 /NCGR_PEP_ID=MMETSP0794_2-20130614/29315_1 /TAXON_ID=515487 /ORGANISM="Stephanopyxis turris, Strain CCMP 815" /LENGTH=272 /DNA_ID=CAMNT_0040658503 /DNA_START=142 /DNA_END=960 /DNA_ORIENTATION=+